MGVPEDTETGNLVPRRRRRLVQKDLIPVDPIPEVYGEKQKTLVGWVCASKNIGGSSMCVLATSFSGVVYTFSVCFQ